MGILNQNFQISNLKSIFKPIRKLSHFFPKIKKITLGVLKVCKVSAKSKDLFGYHPSIHHPSVRHNKKKTGSKKADFKGKIDM